MPVPGEEVPGPLWLSHHPPDQYDRCVRIAGRPVCRRCLVLYPVAAISALVVASLAPASAPPVLMLILPVPAVVDWWLEHLGRVHASARRLVVVTLPAGAGLGLGFARYLDAPGDLWFWGMVLGYGGACAAVALWQYLDEHAP